MHDSDKAHRANLERLESLLVRVVETAITGPVQRLSDALHSQQARLEHTTVELQRKVSTVEASVGRMQTQHNEAQLNKAHDSLEIQDLSDR